MPILLRSRIAQTAIKVLTTVLFVVPFVLAHSQQAAAPLPSFEAATLKPTPPGKSGSGVWSPPGISRFWANSLSVQFLVQMAFGVEADQIAGKPSWLDSDFYDVEAKPEEGVALSREQLKPRLQNLLAERFHLTTHFETRTVRGYALIPAKGGPKLERTQGGRPPGYRVYVGAGRIEGINWTMPFLASMLQRVTHFQVEDQTGLSGSYDIKLNFAPDMEQESALPSLFTAVGETLGLQLKPRQIPVQVLVIDHIDRVPTQN